MKIVNVKGIGFWSVDGKLFIVKADAAAWLALGGAFDRED